MYSVTKLVVAGAIVALFGGFLLAGVLTPPREEAAPAIGATASPLPTPTRPVELPAEIPEGIASGTLDTPLGAARWVYLSGDPETLPDILQPIPVPGGYVTFDEASQYGPCPTASGSCIDPAELWFSPDLIEWTRRQLPVEADFPQLTVAGGEFWLTVADELEDRTAFELPALWRSTDALEWEAVDLSGLEAPLPTAIEWLASPVSGVAVSGDAILVQMGYRAQVGKSLLGLPLRPEGEDRTGDYAGLERIDGETFRVLGPYGDEHGRVRFEEIDGGLRVIDDETGAELTIVEGIDMDFIGRWTAFYGYPAEYRLALLRGDRVDMVQLPGAAVAGWSFALLGTDDGFMALRSGPEGETQVWTSPDGLAWAHDGLLGDDPGEPVADGVWSGPDGLIAGSYDEANDVLELWRTSNGIDWQHHVGRGDGVVQLEAGWVELVDGGLAFYPGDAEDPTLVDTTDLDVNLESLLDGRGPVRMSANTIAYTDGYYQQREHWIITFDDPSP